MIMSEDAHPSNLPQSMSSIAHIIPTLCTLYGYLQSYAWEEVENMLHDAPHLFQHKLPNGNTCLHEISSIGCAPNQLVEKIVQIYPDAAMIPNKYGDLPL